MTPVLLLAVLAAAAELPASKPVLVPRLDVKVPVGWRELPNLGGPVTYSPKADDSAGVLQVSRMPDKDFAFVANAKELGPLAAELGSRLPEWGKPLANKDASCAMGRAGLAMFQGGRFPATLLWVTVSSQAAYVWTWLGPSPQAQELKDAQAVVLGAVEAKRTVSPELGALVAALERISLARQALSRGANTPDQLHLAVLTDEGGKVSGLERPVLSGRLLQLAATKGSKVLPFEVRFDEDPARRFTFTVSIEGEKARLSLARDPKARVSEPLRLRAASLWGLTGVRVDAPYKAIELEATVQGAALVKVRVPANYENPGKGSWLLFKSTKPAELYVAVDVEGGVFEVFPSAPLSADEAGRA
ncbi:MAG: hypothetical protein JNK82_22690, partial [Myxococcaceae bacterium]|nr:hypothetical protein [Myxococcaceae bacterium]